LFTIKYQTLRIS